MIEKYLRFRFWLSPNWLKAKSSKEIFEEKKELYLEGYKTEINPTEWLSGKNSWKLIVPITILLFILGHFLKTDWLGYITISDESVNRILENRVANIAVITSITLVVIGFLLNNISVKEAFTYRILFKRSFLYPITYFALSNIGFLFIVSLLKDTLQPEIIKDFIITGSYMAIIILILIGTLLGAIIRFTNPKTIADYLSNELLNETLIGLKNIQIRRKSEEIFERELSDSGSSTFSFTALDGNFIPVTNVRIRTQREINEQRSLQRYISDMKISKLKKVVQEKLEGNQAEITHMSVGIGSIIEDKQDVISGKPHCANHAKMIKRSVKTSRNDRKIPTEAKKHFEEKFELAVMAENHLALESILSVYRQVYELQIKYEN